ncbi:hypothetical protein FISHEDRAFT_61334 [Fistulina hepatica ATCC 64428]|uniref:Uncharacterized protein n=1 Tax=Fistulina hepatica ATCC 64428 TaxID=1128425 RepID=A0A0D7A294_9AGAR|nr:hypothetical protein FISHEDRAFT_61334 [Fistulina hepatica ATCC 64428]
MDGAVFDSFSSNIEDENVSASGRRLPHCGTCGTRTFGHRAAKVGGRVFGSRQRVKYIYGRRVCPPPTGDNDSCPFPLILSREQCAGPWINEDPRNQTRPARPAAIFSFPSTPPTTPTRRPSRTSVQHADRHSGSNVSVTWPDPPPAYSNSNNGSVFLQSSHARSPLRRPVLPPSPPLTPQRNPNDPGRRSMWQILAARASSSNGGRRSSSPLPAYHPQTPSPNYEETTIGCQTRAIDVADATLPRIRHVETPPVERPVVGPRATQEISSQAFNNIFSRLSSSPASAAGSSNTASDETANISGLAGRSTERGAGRFSLPLDSFDDTPPIASDASPIPSGPTSIRSNAHLSSFRLRPSSPSTSSSVAASTASATIRVSPNNGVTPPAPSRDPDAPCSSRPPPPQVAAERTSPTLVPVPGVRSPPPVLPIDGQELSDVISKEARALGLNLRAFRYIASDGANEGPSVPIASSSQGQHSASSNTLETERPVHGLPRRGGIRSAAAPASQTSATTTLESAQVREEGDTAGMVAPDNIASRVGAETSRGGDNVNTSNGDTTRAPIPSSIAPLADVEDTAIRCAAQDSADAYVTSLDENTKRVLEDLPTGCVQADNESELLGEESKANDGPAQTDDQEPERVDLVGDSDDDSLSDDEEQQERQWSLPLYIVVPVVVSLLSLMTP